MPVPMPTDRGWVSGTHIQQRAKQRTVKVAAPAPKPSFKTGQMPSAEMKSLSTRR